MGENLSDTRLRTRLSGTPHARPVKAAIGSTAFIMTLALGLAACQAECSMSTARLTEARMASAIDAETKAPTTPASTFGPGTPSVYATAKLSNAPDDTKVKATFHYLEGGDRPIAEDEVQAGGTRFVAFTLTAPTSGWPAGQYETRLLLNGKEVVRIPFNVSPATGAAPSPGAAPAAPAPPPSRASAPEPIEHRAAEPAAATKRFRDPNFGIDFELPSSWTYRLTPSKDYLFEGPKGTDAFELALIVQFVTKADNPKSSAAAQASEIAGKIGGIPGAAITTRDTMTVSGQAAPYFVATYKAADSTGASLPFAHTQLVVDHGAYYYLISFAGPTPIYQKHLGVFQAMVQTLRLTP
jgi:hypothetical protein